MTSFYTYTRQPMNVSLKQTFHIKFDFIFLYLFSHVSTTITFFSFGKSSPMNMESIQMDIIMATQTFNSRESMSTITRSTVIVMCLVLFLSTWNQAQWTLFVLLHMDVSSVPTIIFSDNLVPVTTGQRDTTLKVLN
jgi:hypothetical protein